MSPPGGGWQGDYYFLFFSRKGWVDGAAIRSALSLC